MYVMYIKLYYNYINILYNHYIKLQKYSYWTCENKVW